MRYGLTWYLVTDSFVRQRRSILKFLNMKNHTIYHVIFGLVSRLSNLVTPPKDVVIIIQIWFPFTSLSSNPSMINLHFNSITKRSPFIINEELISIYLFIYFRFSCSVHDSKYFCNCVLYKLAPMF